MQINVVKNAKRNMLFGSVNRVVVLLIPFIKRLIVRNALGSQYLGLGSLFQSVIQVLSLSEHVRKEEASDMYQIISEE